MMYVTHLEKPGCIINLIIIVRKMPTVKFLKEAYMLVSEMHMVAAFPSPSPSKQWKSGVDKFDLKHVHISVDKS